MTVGSEHEIDVETALPCRALLRPVCVALSCTRSARTESLEQVPLKQCQPGPCHPNIPAFQWQTALEPRFQFHLQSMPAVLNVLKIMSSGAPPILGTAGKDESRYQAV